MQRIFDVTAARPSIQWSWITLMGRDARDFLHRLTTVNVSNLNVGEGSPGFFLTAQGKVRAFFTLWRFGEEDFAFEFDAGASGSWKRELLAAIDQYTFAEKFTLADTSTPGASGASPLESRWIFSADANDEAATLAALGAPALNPGGTLALGDEIRVCHHGNVDFGRPWITAWGRPARLQQWLERALPEAQPVRPEEIEQWRVLALRPRVDAEITSATIPLEAGLTDALAQSKGCYPGQEVIERIISMGAPPRRLVLIEGTGELPVPGDAILNLADPAAEVGQVTSVTNTDGGKSFHALGFVRKIHAKDGMQVRFGRVGSLGSIRRVAPYA